MFIYCLSFLSFLYICNTIAFTMSNQADKIGALASFVCLIHCLMTPLISVGILITPALWHGLEWVFAAISIAAVVLVHRSGISRSDSIMLISALTVLLTGIVLEHYVHGVMYVVMAMGLVLASIHVKRLYKSSFFRMMGKRA